MPIDFIQVQSEIGALGEAALQNAQELEQRIPQAIEDFHNIARLAPAELSQRTAKAGVSWRGAIPTSEKPDRFFSPSLDQKRLNVVGADGSQIFPDRHALALYYLINIASISIEYQSGTVPRTRLRPRLFFKDEDLYSENDDLIQNDFVSMQRDVWELEELAAVAEEHGKPPMLTLLDNGLLLYPRLQDSALQKEQDQLLKRYIGQLDRLRNAGAALAGFIDRSRSAEVLRLAHLASLPMDAIEEEALKIHPYRGATDRLLFSRLLPPGHRSARFIGTSKQNKNFGRLGHSIQFFYLHTGYQDLIARVEIPEWIGEDQELLSIVHSGLLVDSQITGIPYVLVRAHELAVVSKGDRDSLERMLRGVLIKNRLMPAISQKAQTKVWTG
jgi:hypothetical protein